MKSRTESSVEQILDVVEGCKRPVWGASFAKLFSTEESGTKKQPAKLTPADRQARRAARIANEQAREAYRAKRQERQAVRAAARSARQAARAKAVPEGDIKASAEKGAVVSLMAEENGGALPEELQMWCTVSEGGESGEEPSRKGWFNAPRLRA